MSLYIHMYATQREVFKHAHRRPGSMVGRTCCILTYWSLHCHCHCLANNDAASTKRGGSQLSPPSSPGVKRVAAVLETTMAPSSLTASLVYGHHRPGAWDCRTRPHEKHPTLLVVRCWPPSPAPRPSDAGPDGAPPPPSSTSTLAPTRARAACGAQLPISPLLAARQWTRHGPWSAVARSPAGAVHK